MKRLNNRGTVDVTSWLMGIAGFTITYFVWSFASPIIKSLIVSGTAMMLPDIANNQFVFIQNLFDYAMIFNAGVWILYIILSSIQSEVEERVFMG